MGHSFSVPMRPVVLPTLLPLLLLLPLLQALLLDLRQHAAPPSAHLPPTCWWYCWYMPGAIWRVTSFCLHLHLRLPAAGLMTALSLVTWAGGRGA